MNKILKHKMPASLLSEERAGLNGIVAHDAIDDAWDVIQLFRAKR